LIDAEKTGLARCMKYEGDDDTVTDVYQEMVNV
jgi:hypothetical protein